MIVWVKYISKCTSRYILLASTLDCLSKIYISKCTSKHILLASSLDCLILVLISKYILLASSIDCLSVILSSKYTSTYILLASFLDCLSEIYLKIYIKIFFYLPHLLVVRVSSWFQIFTSLECLTWMSSVWPFEEFWMCWLNTLLIFYVINLDNLPKSGHLWLAPSILFSRG